MKLPKTILMYPMTLASTAAHLVMRFQQNLAELAIKGDSTLESLFPPKEEKPEWATFDEDLPDAAEISGADAVASPEGGDADRRAEGRFALYSITDAPEAANPPTNAAAQSTKSGAASAKATKGTKGTKATKAPAIPEPPVAAELDYPTLTLAQLRARLQSLDVDELEALLAYEQATKARAPFQTLLANRITRANAK